MPERDKAIIQWDANDASALRAFLRSCPKFIPYLTQCCRRCEGDTMEERAVTGSERQGAQDLILRIEYDMTIHPSTMQSERGGFIGAEGDAFEREITQ